MIIFYNKASVSKYMFYGEFVLADGITNPKGFIPTIEVNLYALEKVLNPDEEEAVEPKDSVVEAPIDQQAENELPETASSYYTIILVGSLIFVIAVMVYLWHYLFLYLPHNYPIYDLMNIHP